MPSFQPKVIRIDLVFTDSEAEHNICYFWQYDLQACTSTLPFCESRRLTTICTVSRAFNKFNLSFLDTLRLNFGIRQRALIRLSLTSKAWRYVIFITYQTCVWLQNDLNISYPFYIFHYMVSSRIENLWHKFAAMPLNVYVDDVIVIFSDVQMQTFCGKVCFCVK